MAEFKQPTGLISDVSFSIPAVYVEASCGLALDIGCTVGKLVYRSNKEYKDGKPRAAQDDVTKGVAHYAMFPRMDVDGMIKYINENADLTRNAEGELWVQSGGVGAAAFRTKLQNGLNCKLKILPETDCFANAFLVMEQVFSNEELCIPKHEKLVEFAVATQKRYDTKIKKMLEMTKMKMPSKLKSGNQEDNGSRLLVMGGSGTGIFQISSDGSCTFMDIIGTAGMFMYGLASVLTGEKDFTKLVALAGKGDGLSSDTWTDDILGEVASGKNQSGDNIYESGFGQENKVLFPFGKGFRVQHGDIKKEDLAYSAFRSTALAHCQTVNLCAKLSNAKHVYFAGNLFNTELMRRLISERLIETSVHLAKESKYDFHFLRNGGMFGALGAFMNEKTAD